MKPRCQGEAFSASWIEVVDGVATRKAEERTICPSAGMRYVQSYADRIKRFNGERICTACGSVFQVPTGKFLRQEEV